MENNINITTPSFIHTSTITQFDPFNHSGNTNQLSASTANENRLGGNNESNTDIIENTASTYNNLEALYQNAIKQTSESLSDKNMVSSNSVGIIPYVTTDEPATRNAITKPTGGAKTLDFSARTLKPKTKRSNEN